VLGCEPGQGLASEAGEVADSGVWLGGLLFQPGDLVLEPGDLDVAGVWPFVGMAEFFEALFEFGT
jgi:hypothetical protein